MFYIFALLVLLCPRVSRSFLFRSTTTPSSARLCIRCNAGFALVSSKTNNDDENEESQVVIRLTPDSNCPCGSGTSYGKCCSPFHSHEQEPLDPVALIRSRYSAYALENLDYIVETTSSNSPDYLAYIESPIGARNGKKKWIKDIRRNMIDTFAYVRMEVDSMEVESDDCSIVYYRHLAIRKLDNIFYPILEKAYCRLTDGVWKYEKAEVQRPEAELSQKMMEDWPLIAGLKLVGKPREEQEEGNNEPKKLRPRRATPTMPGMIAPPKVRGGMKGDGKR